MKISIIIPNFNGAALLQENLPHVNAALSTYEKKTGEKGEIIITDDASTDNSHEIVTKMPFPVRYLSHEKNAGFSTNVNRGVKQATGEIVVLLNTDVCPEKEFLFPLLNHFQNEKIFAVGCMDKSIEDGKEVLRGRGIGTWNRGFLIHAAGSVSEKNTLWASGGSSAFRKNMWDTLHGMYEIYNPFYWEDIDLSYRAKKSGYLVIFEPESKVVHIHTKGSIKTQFTEGAITSIAYRNQCLFVWINITDVPLIISHIIWIPLHLIMAILRGDRAFVIGFIKALLLAPKVHKYRRRNKRLFSMSDKKVLKGNS